MSRANGDTRPETAWGTDSHPAALVRLSVLLALSGWALWAVAWPPDLSRLPAVPTWNTLEVLLRSPGAPLDGVLQVAVVAAWLVWFWAAGSLVIELILASLENGPARGAAWVSGARSVASRVTLPLARRAVAAAIVVQVVTRTAAPAAASAYASAASAVTAPAFTPHRDGALFTLGGVVELHATEPDTLRTLTSEAANLVTYRVQPRDTLWAIAERYYGSGQNFERLLDANDGKVMPDGRVFDRAGLIFPGWVLDIPDPNAVVDQDGHAYYVVRRDDTLCGIAAGLLGDENRYRELFDLNVGTAQLANGGPVLADPDLIWPGLRLQLPDDVRVGTPPSEEAGPADEPNNQVPPLERSAPSPVGGDAESAVTPTVLPVPIATSTPTEPIAAPLPLSEEPATMPALPPAQEVTPVPTPRSQLAMPLAVAGGAVAVAGLAGAAALVVRRRKQAPLLREPECDTVIDDGFAEVDPSRSLAAGAPNPAAIVARKLSRAYATEFMAMVQSDNAAEIMAGISVVATRHGRSSTTLTITAPPAARAHLIQHLEPAVASAFGDDVDTEALVTHDGDVLVRLTGVNRYVTRGRLLELVGPEATDAEIWPPPFLVPLGLLNDRQTLAVNWDALGNVLVTAPVGQGAEAIVTSLVTSLATQRAPSDLGLVTIAAPRSLPVELGRLPHQLIDIVDPARGPDGLAAIQDVVAELSRRIAADATGDSDLVVVIRELADLDSEQMAAVGRVAAAGPQYRVRLLAASERPALELVQRCELLNYFSTRVVLQAADEDESVALLGTPGAEELSSAGQVLLRLDGRTPVQANAFRVPPQHLTRLLKLMGERPQASVAQDASGELASEPPVEPISNGPVEEVSQEAETASDVASNVAIELSECVDDRVQPEVAVVGRHRTDPPEREEAPATTTDPVVGLLEDASAAEVAASGIVDRSKESRLLQQLRRAPLRVQCFGGRGVWHGDELLWPRPGVVEETGWELLLILAIHPVAGVQSETLVDIIWPDKPPERPSASLRKRRWRLRQELKQLLPSFEDDPLPTDPNGLVYSLDPAVIASDVHLFLELIAYAKSLPREEAIVAYEEALALYHGDLLDSPDVPTYWWLYNGHALATTLRSDYRRQERDVRLLLADLCSAGSSAAELMRAQGLYAGLTAEDPENERLWTALFRIHGRRGDSMGLEAAARRLRTTLVELGKGEDPDKVVLPPTLERVLMETRAVVAQRPGGAVA